MMLLTNVLQSQRVPGASQQGLREQLETFRAKHPAKSLQVAGATWDYLIGGTGLETIMLLPGGTNSNELLFQVISAFEPTYRVIAPRYASVATMREMLDGLLAILDAAGVKQAHVLGESFGGLVAQCLVRCAPSRVASLILVSTLAPTKRWAPRMRRSARLLALMPWSLYLRLARREMAKALAALPIAEGECAFWTAEVLDQIDRISKSWLVNTYRVSLDLCEHYTFTPADLAGWRGRVLIMRADDDAALRSLATYTPTPLPTLYPQAQVHVFHGSGHVPPITRREEYLRVIQQFLAQVPSQRRTNEPPLQPPVQLH
jgi:pimeloyl-ACP methyl ester carboxylesterase